MAALMRIRAEAASSVEAARSRGVGQRAVQTAAWRRAGGRAWHWLCLSLLLALAACSGLEKPEQAGSQDAVQDWAHAEAAPQPVPCPKALLVPARCLAGQDQAGAYYMVAVPAAWNGHLVLHAHGGPALGPPRADRVVEDLVRWSIAVREGYAWAGSSFRQGGVEVRAAAQDTERLRQIFVRHVAPVQRTILHGQSWGAGVAAKGAEMFVRTPSGGRPYDAVLLTSGVLAGGSRSYDVRMDLRVLYQYLCNNHPRPSEPAYALNTGLPAQDPMTAADLRARLDECLALGRPRAERTPEQQRKLQTLVDVLKMPESSIAGHMAWATFHFRDVVQHRTAGASPFGNVGAVYRGSPDDERLNAAVQRWRADPVAVARFAQDTDPQGRIPVPVLTVKGVGDAVAFVEMDAHFRSVLDRAGNLERLVQTFTAHEAHSYLSDATYATLLSSLLRWVEQGQRPTPHSIAQQCRAQPPERQAGCAFLPDYVPAPLHSRVPSRQQP